MGLLEDIKKEILKLDEIVFNSNYRYEPLKDTNLAYRKSDILEILDKYKDIDKYKNAWEDLKQVDMGEEAPSFGELWEDMFKELEQEHNISKEN